MKKNIAIIWGGYSSEKEVSERSAAGIYSFIDKDRYHAYKVKIDRSSWEAEHEGTAYPVDKNDFSFTTGEKRIVFDFAYITIHGTPGEDGLLQGYFDMLQIPYSNCGVLASSLSFNKYVCNHFLKGSGVRIAPSVCVRSGDTYDGEEIIKMLGLPLFVKPNLGGSSFAVTKVKKAGELVQAVSKAFGEAPEVIIEKYVAGTEVTCGCFETAKGFTVLPLTEVVTDNEFFDYDAKYNGQVQEITPARIDERVAREIGQTTRDIYFRLGAKGIIRADYIVSEEQPVLLEVNTTPGMTQTSFIPQQVHAAGLSMTDVLSDIIETEYDKRR